MADSIGMYIGEFFIVIGLVLLFWKLATGGKHGR